MNRLHSLFAFFLFLATAACASAASSHPLLLLPSSELPAVKEKIRTQEWARQTLAQLEEKYASPIEAENKLPDRGGQWFHWYACPIHGVRLRPESPTRHVCPIDGQVFTGYPYDDCYLSFVHDRLAIAVREMGLLYSITGKRTYADRAKAIALAYANKYASYPFHDPSGQPKAGGGKITPQTLDEAIWLIRVAQGVDQIWDTFTPEEIETLRTKLFYPAVDVIRQHNMGIHNIECWKGTAVGLTGFLFHDPALIKEAIDGPTGFRNQLAKGVSKDGAWREGAWGYHFYTLDALLPLAEAARNNGDPSLYCESLHAMFTAPLMLALPNGKLPAFNDSDAAVTPMGDPAYEQGIARFNDPSLATAITTRNTINSLVFGPPTLPNITPTTPSSRDFPDTGYCILRSKDLWLCLKYGPHGGGHGHYDKGTFVLVANGSTIADDAGNSPYGLPIHRGWHKTTLAHNTVSADQTNQAESTGRSLSFQTGTDWSAFLLDAGPVYPHVTFRRGAVIFGDTAVFIDLLNSDDSHNHLFDLSYHPAGKWPDFGPSWKKANAPTTQPGQSPAYEYLQDGHTTSDISTFSVVSPAGPQNITFVPITGTQYWAGTGVGKNTADRVPLLLARRHATHTCYAWAVSIGSDKPILTPLPIPQTNASALRVTIAGKDHLIIVNPDSESIHVEDYAGKDRLVVR